MMDDKELKVTMDQKDQTVQKERMVNQGNVERKEKWDQMVFMDPMETQVLKEKTEKLV